MVFIFTDFLFSLFQLKDKRYPAVPQFITAQNHPSLNPLYLDLSLIVKEMNMVMKWVSLIICRTD